MRDEISVSVRVGGEWALFCCRIHLEKFPMVGKSLVASSITTFSTTDSNGRHVVDEVHLRLLVLDNSSSTAGRSTHFETSY
ncbi:hypothetical protein T07_14870 [Trichinella nelsoni]|uniref:Uncharacterized protein n=1 Tax=Trichinella nelsoni TaxID=6336 RepID=A0A0V0RJD9_9BILA|nr:hypothetical protein T07_14870 [Trichinella nelsoni]